MGRDKKNALGTYNTNSEIKFETTMLKSNLFYYSDAYILVKGTITIIRVAVYRQNEQITFKGRVTFTISTSKINITKVDNAKNIGVVMSIYSLLEFNCNYSQTSGR